VSKTAIPIGAIIREHRKAHELSLEELSSRTGITISTLSRIESGKTGATFDRIEEIANGLGVRVQELFVSKTASAGTDSGARTRRAVSRAGACSVVRSDHYEYESLCWEFQDQALFPVRARVLCRNLEAFGPLVRHPGQEFIYVLRGRARVVLEHYEDTILEPEDALYIDSEMGHAILDASDDGNTVILGTATVKRPAT
jgi:transcriptional regulator with XRE-family HTH domain